MSSGARRRKEHSQKYASSNYNLIAITKIDPINLCTSVHQTKLLWIDVLRQSKWRIHIWIIIIKAEDLHHCVSKFGNWIIKMCKIRWFPSQKSRIRYMHVDFFVNNLTRKHEKALTTNAAIEMRYCLQIFTFFKLSLPLVRSSNYFEDAKL